MRGLPLLSKLAQTDADHRRYELGRIVVAHESTRAALEAQDRTATQEAERAGASMEARAAYGGWLRVDRRPPVGLDEREAQLDRTEDGARAALREAVIEMKRFETVQRSVPTEERRMAARKAEARADELHATRVRDAR